MTATTLHTSFGPVRTGSTRPFIAVIEAPAAARIGGQHVPAGVSIFARAETRKALEARLHRHFGFDRETGLFGLHTPAKFIEGEVVLGERIATVEIVEVAK